MMQAASYPLTNEATQHHHPMDEGVPRGVLLSVSIGLDPHAIAYGGDGALKQLSPLGLSLEEVLNEVVAI
jgi:hypothetical protein